MQLMTATPKGNNHQPVAARPSVDSFFIPFTLYSQLYYFHFLFYLKLVKRREEIDLLRLFLSCVNTFFSFVFIASFKVS